MQFHVITEPQAALTLRGEELGAPAVVNLESVDWEREFAVVADMGEQRTGGYGLVLRSVSVENGSATIDVEIRRPSRGSMVIQVISHPTLLVRVPRAGLGPGARVVVRDQDGNELARLEPPL